MSKTYRVFLGAPSFSDIQRDLTSYSWRTFSSPSSSDTTPLSRKSTRLHADQTGRILGVSQTEAMSASNGFAFEDVNAPARSQVQSASVILPVDLLETASERISMIYKDAIFGGEESDDEDSGQFMLEENEENEVEISVFHGADQTSLYTWPSTSMDQTDASASRVNLEGSLLLLRTQSPDLKLSEPPAKSQQEFSTTQPESQSFGIHSWTSSISRFPAFSFSLHTLFPLSSLSAHAEAGTTKSTGKFTQKVNLLLAVLEIEGPDTITIKKGVDAGKEVSILKIILGDEENNVCKLTAWREIAEEWGGCNPDTEGAKRGDVVYLQNVVATCEPTTSITLTASSYLKSTQTICYRTMPSTLQDGKLRPDLRLAISEPCVRKVSGIVRWFEQMAGLAIAEHSGKHWRT